LIPLNKDNGKGDKVDNLRPFSMVNLERKALSKVVLERISDKIVDTISPNQSGFREGRSTADMVWTYRWIITLAEKYDYECNIMEIDLTKKYLLSETTQRVKIDGEHGNEFQTMIGVPQGDALSPLLFIFYLDIAMQNYKITQGYQESWERMITHYADDTDFVGKSKAENERQLPPLQVVLSGYNLMVNCKKTEFVAVKRGSCRELKIKKLGTVLADTEDLKYRKQLATTAFNKAWRVWRNKRHITIETRMRLYHACIEPILLYNSGCYGGPYGFLERLDKTQRRHLRRIAQIYHPNRVDNELLYIICRTEPLSIKACRNRWRLLGQKIRSPKDTPANKLMVTYFTLRGHKMRGKARRTLPTLLHQDVRRVGEVFNKLDDLERKRQLAQNRDAWKKFAERVENKNRATAYEAIRRSIKKREERKRKRNQKYQLTAILVGKIEGRVKRVKRTACVLLVIRITWK
jgi:hypothetical protein